MTSWFVMINILLLLSSSFLQARYRAHSKRRYPTPTQSFLPSYPRDDNNIYDNNDDTHGRNNDDSWIGSTKSTTSTTTVSPFQANEEQIEQFTRLLIERLNLKEPPNVTVNVNDDTGFPSSIFKQLEQQTKEQQRIHDIKEHNYHRQQKIHDDVMSTAERAILPGDSIPNHTCQRQLAVKLNLAENDVHNVDCFRFTKSTKESKSLPTNQLINELRLYVKRNYFHLDDQQQVSTPDMFRVYQVFRPTTNDTTHNPPPGLTGTRRLPLSQIKELNDNWFELTIESESEDLNIQQVYKQLIMPWYGLAIDRDVQISSSMARSLPIYDRPYHRQHPSKIDFASSSHLDNDDENNKESSQQQLPYMLVEYGEKIFSSSSGRRGARHVVARPARPARGCHPTSSCCRRSLTIDLDQATSALNFVIYPRQLDIGECVGLCGTSGSSLKYIDVKNSQYKNEQNSAYNLFLLQNGLHYNRSSTAHIDRPDHATQCCSYSRTSALEIMYTTTNGGPIIRKLIPNMVVEEFPPSIRAQSTLIHSTLGKSTHLRCSATAPFDTSLHWRRVDNHTISSHSTRYRQQQHTHGELLHTTLFIKDLEKTDFGFYACYAESKAGRSKAVIELKEHHHLTITSTIAPEVELTTSTTTTVRTQILKRNKISEQTTIVLITNFASSTTLQSTYLLIFILFFLYF